MNCLAVKTFRNKKKDCFKKFAETINFQTNSSYVWNKCKIFKNKWLNTKLLNTNSNLQNSNDIASALNEICPPWCETDPSWLLDCCHNQYFDRPFDFAEFNSVLISKINKSASGHDGIDYEVIKNLPLTYKLLLVDLYNEMFQNNIYPAAWKNSFVIFIDKPNNKGVRPISLTSSLGKLFESLVKNRLQWFCESNNIIPINQSGFRKGRSCTDNLVDLTLYVDQALANKKDVLAVFLDVSAAFDNVNSDILLQKLASIGLSKSILHYIKFIRHRRSIFTESLDNEFRYSFKGVPQGGVLSPLLYILYVADITQGVPKSVSLPICGRHLRIL